MDVKRRPAVLLGFGGPSGSGKDALSSLVFETIGVTPVSVRFGDAIVEELDRLLRLVATHSGPGAGIDAAVDELGLDVRHAAYLVGITWVPAHDGATATRRTPVMRAALQYLGTEARRSADSSYWVRRAVERIDGELRRESSVCCTDVRYPNEVAALRRLGFTLVRLEVDEDLRDARRTQRDGQRSPAVLAAHASERSLPEDPSAWDLILDGASPLDVLAGQVVAALELQTDDNNSRQEAWR